MTSKEQRENKLQTRVNYKEYKAQVEQHELNARFWKAHYEKMFFLVESFNLEERYKEVSTIMEERAIRQFEEAQAKLQENEPKSVEENA